MFYNYYGGMFGNNTKNTGGMNSLYGSLSDCGSIQKGAYKKLLTSYYKKAATSDMEEDADKKTDKKVNQKVTTDAKAYTDTKKYAVALSEAGQDLIGNSNKSLYDEGQEDKLISNVKSFVSAYNIAVKDASASAASSVSNAAKTMVNNTKSYAKSLENIGITVNDKNQLSLDADKLKAADSTEVKRLLGGNNSFVGTTTRLATQIGSAATTASSGMTTYSSAGNYSGLNMNSYFDSLL